MGVKSVTQACELGPKQAVVVDFAIENHDRAGGSMDHWLIAPAKSMTDSRLEARAQHWS